MKNIKKLFALAAAGMVAASLGFVAACDGNNDPAKPDDNPPDDGKPTITYQFTGNYTNETLTGYGFDYNVVLNLWSDGKVSGSSYNNLTMDDRAPQDNTGFAEKWFRGSWSKDRNDEDVEYIKLKTIWDSDAISSMTGQALSGTYDYEVYFKADGTPVNFNLYCPIFGGGTQYPADMTGHKTPVYADNAAFIQGNLYIWTAPENIAVFDTKADGLTAKLFCQDDGKALFYTGKQVPGKQEYKYMPSATWGWAYADGALKITVDGSTEYTATLDGNKATFTHTASVMGHDMTYNFECADITAIKEAGGGTIVTPPEKTLALEMSGENGATLKFYDDNTAELNAFGGMLKPSFTWSVADGVITLTDSENSEKIYTSASTGSTTTIVYAASLGGNNISITFTSDDVSAIVPAATVATLTAADGGYTATFKSDGTVKLTTMSPQLSPEWTWEYAEGAFTFKEANGNVQTAVTLTVEGATGTLTYAPAFLQGSSIVYTGDVSALIAE